jgi:hypothetical protein
MRPLLRRLLIVATLVIALGGGVLFYLYRHDLQRSLERTTLPAAVDYPVQNSMAPAPVAVSPAPSPSPLPAEINLNVPFTSQAPFGNWSLPYKEFCEEASVLMVMRYLQQQPITSPADADAAMNSIKEFEEQRFGYYQDTNVAETAAIFTEHFQYPSVELLENPTAQQIKAALAQGRPVIIPVAGRLLGNPYFQTPGPLYHMLVIKGYTKDGRFITNDPGTRHGADFIYSEATLLNALHDWRTDEQIELGRRVVLIIGQ